MTQFGAVGLFQRVHSAFHPPKANNVRQMDIKIRTYAVLQQFNSQTQHCRKMLKPQLQNG